MFLVNLSADSDYHNQINNLFIPFHACNTTSMIMWLKAGKIVFWSPPIMQEEDYFTAIMNGKSAWEKFRREFPAAYEAGAYPQYLSEMLQWGVNYLVGRKVDKFIKDGSLQLLVWELLHRRPIVMSGQFTGSGHFVCVVGFLSLQHKEDIKEFDDIDMSQVTEIIFDDPYGDPHTKYKDHHGNDVHMSIREFDRITNTSRGKKWMHLQREEGWTDT
jgi:hypothetical protein